MATHGAAIGGERFDSLLFDGFLAAPLGLTAHYGLNGKKLSVPKNLRQMGTLHGVLSMVGDDRTRRILDNFRAARGGDKLRTIDEILYGGHGYNFFRSVEGAKIDLSSNEHAAVRFVRPGIDVSQQISQSEFSDLIGPDLDRVDATIEKTLADAGVRPDE